MNETLALCGDIPRDEVISYFPNATIVVWSPRIKYLYTKGDVSNRWKVQEAIKRGIPVREWVPPQISNGELWVDKYAPKHAAEIIGNDAGCKEIHNWLKSWKTGPPEGKRAVFITGPPGIGKTTAAHLLAKYCGYNIVEQNASCIRSASSIRELFREAAKSSHIGKARVVIMDEVDGMSSGDRGGIAALADILKTCTFPVICIANERGSPRLRPLNAVCIEVKFTRPHKSSISKALGEIVKKEKLSYTKAQLEDICERNGNDIRQILNFLQIGCGSMKDEALRLDMWNATRRLYDTSLPLSVRNEACWVDPSMIPLMVQEGYAIACGKSRGNDIDRLQRCSTAADLLCAYDILDKRIHSSQAWGLLPSAMSIITGVAATTGGAAPHVVFPSYLGKQSKCGKHRRLYEDIRRRTRSSDVYDSIGVYRARLFGLNDADTICTSLQDMGLTRDIMFDTLPETVFEGDEDSVKMSTKLKTEVSRKWKKLGIDEEIVKKSGGADADAEELDEYVSEDEFEEN